MILEQASKAYYEGKPIMTDEEFDAISSDYEKIGYSVEGNTHQHRNMLWSLQKAYDSENPLSWYSGEIVVSPKLDGAAVSLEYKDGKLIAAATRGDGKQGLLITEKMALLVPAEISIPEIQIVGEVVAPIEIKNSRNYAAGALNLKDLEEFSTRSLQFIAYATYPTGTRWTESMALISQAGFSTVLDSDWSQYPQDGKVYRINSSEAFDNAGYTAKFPRGAYAYKERPQGVVTTLLGVEWNVGRSGVVAPTAILDPVKIGEATVSRATLHNMAYIESLNLEIGCQVEVIRSGEIIPRIVRRV